MFAYQFYKPLPLGLKTKINATAIKLLRPFLTHHFSRFISSGDLVFDVGAHAGEYTQMFLDLGARVVAIDPQPSCVKRLKKRFSENENVVVIDKGLGDREGMLEFSISTKAPDNSTFSRAWKQHARLNQRNWDKNIQVPVITMDALIRRFGPPDFCKIDVEGYELQVFKGLKTPIPIISYEFDQEFFDVSRLCAEYLLRFGDVRFNYSLYVNPSLHSKRWLRYPELFNELERQKNGCLRGDIFARVF